MESGSIYVRNAPLILHTEWTVLEIPDLLLNHQTHPPQTAARVHEGMVNYVIGILGNIFHIPVKAFDSIVKVAYSIMEAITA